MSTTTSPATTFDLTFDHTFGGVLLTPVNPSVPGCREPGAYLTWLSPVGWAYWLFEGPINTAKAVSTRGQAAQGGTTRYSQKEAATQLTIRTIGVPTELVEPLATVYESISVYLLAPDGDDVFHPIPVSIEPGTFDLEYSRHQVHDLEVRITLPARRSARS